MHMGFVLLISILAPSPGRADISTGAQFIFRMTRVFLCLAVFIKAFSAL